MSPIATACTGKDAMAYVAWLSKGPKIASCNCDHGTGRPTRGGCEGLEAQRIEQGHFGEGAALAFRNRDCHASLTSVAYGPSGIVP